MKNVVVMIIVMIRTALMHISRERAAATLQVSGVGIMINTLGIVAANLRFLMEDHFVLTTTMPGVLTAVQNRNGGCSLLRRLRTKKGVLSC